MEKDDPLKDVQKLTQPLLTDEGFANPACMRELETAIGSMPPDHERLASDSEWSTKRLTSLKDIMGAFAKCSVGASPYAFPEKLEVVMGYLNACLCGLFPKPVPEKGVFPFVDMSLCDISKTLHEILDDIPEFKDWNTPKDGNKDPIHFASAMSVIPPDSDFIDLDALIRNVCLDIRMERRAFDKFNQEFEANHGKLMAEDV